MSQILDRLSWLVTVRPYITLIVLTIVTFVLGAGATFRAPPTEGADVAFLPPGHAIANATEETEELFGDSGEYSVVTLLFRGEALTPDGLSQMSTLINEIVSDPSVGELLAPSNAIVAPSSLIGAVLQVDGFESITQAGIDSVRNVPEIQGALAAMTGTDTDGTPVAIANIRLSDMEEGMGPLIGLALLLIAALLLLFTRTLSDMLLTLAGLVFSITWVVGAEGWLGPNALGLIGPPSLLTAMVPVVIISLTVDYAIQAVSHYREQRVAGEPVVPAVLKGLRNVTVPLTLAAVTTIVSLLVALFSPIGVIGDFGIVAGLGVGMSLIVMLTLIPAGRTIIDRRRESRGKLAPAHPISNALPGIPQVAELLGKWVTRHPTPYLVGVIAVTIGLG